MTTPARKQTPAEARRKALQSEFTPLYAVAGLTDVLAAGVKETLTQIKSAPQQIKALPELTRAGLAEAQTYVTQNYRQASNAYAHLASRGKRAVDDRVGSARRLSIRAERKVEDVFAGVVEAVDPTFERVQETVTVARRTVTGRTATETVTPRRSARAAAARKASAERASAADAAAAQRSADRAAARSAAAKRGAAKRAAAKAAAAVSEQTAGSSD
jgi:hypothetical protein